MDHILTQPVSNMHSGDNEMSGIWSGEANEEGTHIRLTDSIGGRPPVQWDMNPMRLWEDDEWAWLKQDDDSLKLSLTDNLSMNWTSEPVNKETDERLITGESLLGDRRVSLPDQVLDTQDEIKLTTEEMLEPDSAFLPEDKLWSGGVSGDTSPTGLIDSWAADGRATDGHRRIRLGQGEFRQGQSGFNTGDNVTHDGAPNIGQNWPNTSES